MARSFRWFLRALALTILSLLVVTQAWAMRVVEVRITDVLKGAAAIAQIPATEPNVSTGAEASIQLGSWMGGKPGCQVRVAGENDVAIQFTYGNERRETVGSWRVEARAPLLELVRMASGMDTYERKRQALALRELRMQMAEAARILNLLAHAADALADGDHVEWAIRQAEAAVELGIPLESAAHIEVSESDIRSLVSVAEGISGDLIIEEWLLNDPRVIQLAVEVELADCMRWWPQSNAARIGLEVEWCRMQPEPTIGIQFSWPLGRPTEKTACMPIASAQAKLELARARSQIELGRVLGELNDALGSYQAASFGEGPSRKSAGLRTAAATLCVLAGLGMDVRASGDDLVVARRISGSGV